MPAALGLSPAFRYYACRGEISVDLIIKFLAVGNDHECPVSRHVSQHILCKENHRHRFAAALGMPEHAEPALALLDVGKSLQSIGNAKILMILCEQLH